MKSDTVIGIKKFGSSVMTSYVLVCLVAIFTFFVSSCGKEEAKVIEKKVVRPVKILTLTPSGAGSKLTFPGKVRASQRVDLSFQVAGTLVKLPVVEGTEVKTGDLLAQIDPKDFQTNLRKTQGQLAKTEAALERSQSEYARIIRIKKEDPGATSQTMVDRRRESVDKSKAEIKSYQAAVDGAKDQLSYTYLKAPFSGVIAKRYVDNFKEVRAKEPIVSLQDISQLEIVIDVPENVMATVKKGTSKAFAEFSAAPGRQFKLTAKEIAAEADPNTQTYRVVGAMVAPEGVRILPGMTANVLAHVPGRGGSSEGYIIPAIAVFADEAGNSNVWVVDPDTMKVHKRNVTTGNLTGKDSIQILEGLIPGEKIATTGVVQLREGMEVRDLRELEGYKR
jgi:multidrug efflux system membrane fusion protein